MDYMNHAPKDRHDYDSAHKGGNRYATILLYMSDLEEGDGGETVFPSAWPLGQAEEDNVPLEQVCSTRYHYLFEDMRWVDCRLTCQLAMIVSQCVIGHKRASRIR